jgi:hypothetical protein
MSQEKAYGEGIGLSTHEPLCNHFIEDSARYLDFAEQASQDVEPIELAQRDQGASVADNDCHPDWPSSSARVSAL